MPGRRCRLTAAVQRARHRLITPQRPVNTALPRSLTATPTPIVRRSEPCLLTPAPAVPGPTAHPPTTSAGLPASGSPSPPADQGHQTSAVKHPDPIARLTTGRTTPHGEPMAGCHAAVMTAGRLNGSALRPPDRWQPVPWPESATARAAGGGGGAGRRQCAGPAAMSAAGRLGRVRLLCRGREVLAS
jgi:hypothetical protein